VSEARALYESTRPSAARFDYEQLAPPVAAVARDAARIVTVRLARTVEDILQIGQALQGAKAALGHGYFLRWLAAEVGISRQSAENFMAVAGRFGAGKFPTVGNLACVPPAVLYVLAAPSTPTDVVDAVLAGQVPATLAAIRAASRRARAADACGLSPEIPSETASSALNRQCAELIARLIETTLALEALDDTWIAEDRTAWIADELSQYEAPGDVAQVVAAWGVALVAVVHSTGGAS
jgi:hypothetical protein